MSFGEIITWPFSWLLLTLYELTSSYGLSILLFALAIKLILLPFQMKSKRSTMRTARLTPLMKELEKKCGDDKQRYQQEVARLYKEEHINPMSGCLWTLIPFPILIALYSVIRQPFTRLMRVGADVFEQIKTVATGLGYDYADGAYAEIGLAKYVHQNFDSFSDISDKIVDINFNFLGLNLGDTPRLNFWSDPETMGAAIGLFLIPVLAAVLNYLAMKASNAGNPQAEMQQGSMKGMMLMMPLVSLYICFKMPAALGIYWIAGSVFGIIQDVILNKHFKKQLDAEDAERRERMGAREAELERKRLETERLRELGATKLNENTSKKKLQAKEKAEQEARLAAEKAAERQRRIEAGLEVENPSQVGSRRYARGRAYMEERFVGDASSENTETSEAEEIVKDSESEAK